MPDSIESEMAAALEDCAREPVHIPGAIQPNGCLVSTDSALQRVLQVSANLEAVLGIAPADAQAGNADQLLGPELAHQLRSRLYEAGSSAGKGGLVRRAVRGVERNFSVRYYRSGQRVVIELELQEAETTEDLVPNLNDWLQPVITADSPQQLLDSLALIIRQLTGYDRVMVYQFDEDEHGSVVAECRAAEADSYLGHHFPASDIPAQVRHLYGINPVRSIPDATVGPVPLVPAEDPIDAAPLDLSPGNLRAVSPVHLLYLRNMGVGSALSVAMHDEQRLWGLLACHGLSPRALSPAMRDDIAILVQLATSRLMLLRARLDSRYRQQIRESRELMLIQQSGQLPTPDNFLNRYGANWLTLFNACGLVLLYHDEHFRCGTAPASQQLKGIADYLSNQPAAQHVWQTHSLARSELGDCCEKGGPCGLLAVRLPVNRDGHGWLLLFRPEQQETRIWAGRPEDVPERSPEGKLFLTPRRSFSAWTEVVEEVSEPWAEVECRAALDLGEDLAVVLFSQEVGQLNANLTDANQRLRQLAQTDALTGLPNRRLLEDRVEMGLSRAHRHGHTLALLFLDLDHFKQINDIQGHQAGDKLIQGAAERLLELVRRTDTVARLGGDEFVVLLDEVDSPEDAGRIADKILRAFSAPFELDEKIINVTFSIGVSLYPADGDSFRKLIHHADMAMYQAKTQGRNKYQYYSPIKPGI